MKLTGPEREATASSLIVDTDNRVSRYRSQIREVINRNALVSLALEAGYNAYLPVYDGGVDFILYREADGDLRKVQLKGRWYIDQKYVGRDIWIAFHDAGAWYLAPHDELVTLGDQAGFTATRSWLQGRAYSCPKLSRTMIDLLANYRMFEPPAVAIEPSAS